ncbi:MULTISPECIES: C40 family peptidase [Niastella]|uniref:C40 family peptidase n=1 Tax=Niastella soli TaxID=2821487 RepID=A0ABS3Z586_9BACT|nr:NlpC/P60 family protein [Niastella soli]MBO9205319.1 C40 family peptidase [Niastella soli]
MKRIHIFQDRDSFLFPSFWFAITGCLCLAILLASCSSSRKSTNQYQTIVVKPADPTLAPTNGITVNEMFIKYGAYLKIDPDSLTNYTLYAFIDKWMKTPYKYGGNDEKGIDCSGFIQRLLSDVYNIQVPRTSAQQFFTKNVEPFHGKTYFSEGDLVFFCTVKGQPISHVGMYLHNQYFINASTSSGVSIASLDDPYWKKRFVSAGRVRIVNTPAAATKPTITTKPTTPGKTPTKSGKQ